MIVVGKFLGMKELSTVGNACSIIMIFIVLSGGLEIACDMIIYGSYILMFSYWGLLVHYYYQV